MTALLRHHFDRGGTRWPTVGSSVIACFSGRAGLAWRALGTTTAGSCSSCSQVVARYLVTLELTGTFTVARSSFADPGVVVRSGSRSGPSCSSRWRPPEWCHATDRRGGEPPEPAGVGRPLDVTSSRIARDPTARWRRCVDGVVVMGGDADEPLFLCRAGRRHLAAAGATADGRRARRCARRRVRRRCSDDGSRRRDVRRGSRASRSGPTMTWPVLPASTVLARVLDTRVLFSQHSGVLAKVNDVGAFVLDHRAHFTDHSDAAGELTALLGADPQEVESDLRALEEVLDELTSEGPAAIDPQLGPVRHPPSSAPAARWSLDALGMAVDVAVPQRTARGHHHAAARPRTRRLRLRRTTASTSGTTTGSP